MDELTLTFVTPVT